MIVAVGGLGSAHRRGCESNAVEGTDQVDLHDSLEQVEVVRRLVLAVATDRPGRHADSGGGDHAPERAHLEGGVAGLNDLLGVGDVALDKGAADVPGDVTIILEVGDDDLGAASGQESGGGFAEAGAAAGDDGRGAVQVEHFGDSTE